MWVMFGGVVVVAILTLITLVGPGKVAFAVGYWVYTSRVGLAVFQYAHRGEGVDAAVADVVAGEIELGGNVFVHVVRVLEDNYAYIVEHRGSHTGVLVDVGVAGPVLAVLRDKDIVPVAILTTHYHHDHSAGNPDVVAAFPGIAVVSGERVVEATSVVAGGDWVDLSGGIGDAVRVQVIDMTCHTRGHVAFVVTGAAGSGTACALFSGDALLSPGSVGKFFEGSAREMQDSLSRLSVLGDETLVFPGHEYGLSNMTFAAAFDPNNQDVLAALSRVQEQRQQGLPTIPVTLGSERAVNPFLRVSDPFIVQAAQAWAAARGLPPPIRDSHVLAIVRQAKNAF